MTVVTARLPSSWREFIDGDRSKKNIIFEQMLRIGYVTSFYQREYARQEDFERSEICDDAWCGKIKIKGNTKGRIRSSYAGRYDTMDDMDDDINDMLSKSTKTRYKISNMLARAIEEYARAGGVSIQWMIVRLVQTGFIVMLQRDAMESSAMVREVFRRIMRTIIKIEKVDKEKTSFYAITLDEDIRTILDKQA